MCLCVCEVLVSVIGRVQSYWWHQSDCSLLDGAVSCNWLHCPQMDWGPQHTGPWSSTLTLQSITTHSLALLSARSRAYLPHRPTPIFPLLFNVLFCFIWSLKLCFYLYSFNIFFFQLSAHNLFSQNPQLKAQRVTLKSYQQLQCNNPPDWTVVDDSHPTWSLGPINANALHLPSS